MKAIFAPGHLQSDLHLGPTSGHRLTRFLELLGECGVEASFPSLDVLKEELADANLIIAATRSSDFLETELEVLVNAVTAGQSLLHLSNHKPFPVYDCQLSNRLGYSFKNQCFVNRYQNMPFEFEVNLGALPGHTYGLDDPKKVSINNCSSIAVQNNRFKRLRYYRNPASMPRMVSSEEASSSRLHAKNREVPVVFLQWLIPV